MSPVSRQLNVLESKIERLRREYDLFFAGNRRGAPILLRDELEREILRWTRDPSPSTGVRFRLRTLAHRFQSLDGLVRQRIETGGPRVVHHPQPTGAGNQDASVLLDAAAIANPGAVRTHLLRIHRAVKDQAGSDAANLSLDRLQERLLGEAAKQLAQPGVKGVRFKVVKGEAGTRIRGEVVGGPSG